MSVRNDPCPCGSGRKYKHCCRTSQALRNPLPVNAASADACANCKHWHRQPLPPGPLDLRAPVMGQCRAMPPQSVTIPTAQGMALMVDYPTVKADTPACGQFAAKPALPLTPTHAEEEAR